MPSRLSLPFLLCPLLVSGCLWPVRERTDQTISDLAARAIDVSPEPRQPMPPADPATGLPAPRKLSGFVPLDSQTSLLQVSAQSEKPKQKDVPIPPELPGSEGVVPPPKGTKEEQIRRMYPELPALPPLPKELPGPYGRPYTLTELHQLAIENSAVLYQAASDVETAQGNLIQARTYPNPTVGYELTPSSNGSAGGAVGFYYDQVIKTGGKVKLLAAAAEMDLRNAELALRRARSDLATSVRTAYYNLLVARETARLDFFLSRYTDEIYRYQLEQGLIFASHEPAALRAQAYAARLAYKQAIANYPYAWKQLVAAIGLRQLPLTEVAGRIDRFIPRFDYDTVLNYVLRNHTDLQVAVNGVDKSRYNLKLAQVIPFFPDIEVRADVLKDTVVAPRNVSNTVAISFPLPIWDRNKGNIIAAQGTLGRALEEPHRVETTLTANIATAYAAYKTNLDALEDYRRHILPDLVRYYRGTFERRKADPLASFGDIVTAQQTYATNVGNYLTALGAFWTSVVNVASLLQTEDLFQLSKVEELPELPDLSTLPLWPCHHSRGTPCSHDIPSPNQPACQAVGSQPRPLAPPSGEPVKIPVQVLTVQKRCLEP